MLIQRFTDDGQVVVLHEGGGQLHLAQIPLAAWSYPTGPQGPNPDILQATCPVCQQAGGAGGGAIPLTGGDSGLLGQLLHFRKAYVTAPPGATFTQVRAAVAARLERLEPGRARITDLVTDVLRLADIARQLAPAGGAPPPAANPPGQAPTG